MKRPPTDFELLRAIYERHKGDYEARAAAGGAGRIFVPIDIPAVAKDLGVDENSVFGRLYHHLEEIHGQKRDPNNRAPAKGLLPSEGRTRLRRDRQRRERPAHGSCPGEPLARTRPGRRTFWISVISIGIAVASLVLSVLAVTGQL